MSGHDATAGARGTGPDPAGGPRQGAGDTPVPHHAAAHPVPPAHPAAPAPPPPGAPGPPYGPGGPGGPGGRRGPGPGGPGSLASAGAALAVLAAGGVALVAVLLRPSHRLLAKSGGPLDGTAAVILIALATVGGFLVLSVRYRALVGYQQNLPVLEQRLSDAVRLALTAAALLVPLMLVLMHSFPSGDSNPPPEEFRPATGRPDDTLSVRPLPPPPKPKHGHSLSLPHWLLYVAVAALVLVLLFAGYQLWRHLSSGGSREAPGAYGQLQDEQEVLADAVDSGRRALLLGDDPRAAVIACYAAMEASLAGSGVARRASDSPQDLLERASAGGLLSGPHPDALTRLFREARYSTHPMDTGHRDRAAAALDAIAAQLAERAARAAAEEAAAAPPAHPAGPAGQGPQPTPGARR